MAEHRMARRGGRPKVRRTTPYLLPRRTPMSAALALAFVSLSTGTVGRAIAGPTGGQVTAGAATIQQPNAQTTLIHQTTPRAAIDWTRFSIGARESVVFKQPSSSAVALNRVTGGDASLIYGSLTANGHVFLVNPNGVTFGRGASVDVGSLVASTLSISNADFMSGRYLFSGGAGAGRVVNEGAIRAADGGYVAFIGNQVSNSGTIVANRGSVALGAGDSVLLDFAGDGLLSLKVNTAAAGARIDHGGLIQADGGQVVLSARAKTALASTAMNVDGIIAARGLLERDGKIVLDGGAGVTQVSGTLDASSAQAKGGDIRVLGEYVGLFGDAKLDASGARGGGTVLVGGDFQGRNPDVSNAFRTYVGPNASIRADATASGDGGKVIVWSDDTTRFFGSISARGGAIAGDGGLVEASGKGLLVFRGTADVSAAAGRAGTVLLDPDNIVIAAAGGGNAGDNVLVADGTLAFAEGAGTSTIDENTLEALTGNIVLQATQDITNNAVLDLNNQTAGERVVMQAGRHVTIDGAIRTSGAAIVLEADSPHSSAGAADGTGTLTLNSNLFSNSGAPGGDITLIGAGFSIVPAIVAGAGRVSIASSVNGTAMVLGSGSLNSSEIFQINTSGVTAIGRATTAGSDGLGAGAQTLTAGSITVDTALNMPIAGALSLISNGTVSQTAGSTITGSRPLAVTAGGNVNLPEANNVTTFAASVSAGNSLTFNDVNTLTVGSVDGIAGVNAGGPVALQAGGALTVNSPITNTGATTLVSGANITGTGTISGTNVTLDSVTGVGASGARVNTAATTLAARSTSTTAGAGGVFIQEADAVTLNTLGGVGNATASDMQFDIAAGGAITIAGNLANSGVGAVVLTAGGADSLLTNNAAIASSTAVELNADQMALGGGTIAATIAGTGKVPRVTLRPTTAGQSISLGGADAAGTLGLTQAELDTITATTLLVGRTNAGTHTVDSNIVLDPAKVENLFLVSGGSITGTAGLSVSGLALQAGSANLNNAANDVVTLAANITAAGQSLTFAGDANGFTVGQVDTLDGITTNGGDVSLTTNGPLTANRGITAAGANVALQASSISTGDATNGRIIASGLRTLTSGNTALTSANNNIATYAGQATGGGSTLSYTDANSFDVGSVGALTGVTTNGGIATLIAGAGGAGNLTFSQAINAGASEARLIAANGSITQNAGGTITAGQLSVQARDSTSLTQAGNNIGTLSARITGANQTFAYRDADSFTAGLTGLFTLLGATNSVQTNNGDIALTADSGMLALASPIAAGTGTVTLNATAGSIVQNAGATVTAATLTGNAGTTAALGENNAITNLAAFTTNGAFTLNDVDGLTVGGTVTTTNNGLASITTSGDLSITTGSISASGVTLTATGAGSDILLGSGVNAGAGTLTLTANGAGAFINQTGGAINAATLTGSAATSAALGQANEIGTLGQFTTAGNFALNDNSGGLTIAGPIDAGSGTVTITAGGANSLLTNNATIASSTGVELSADRMALGGGTIAATVAGTGKVPEVKLRPTTPGQLISLGGADAGGTLGLTQAEFDTINATTLVIGRDDASAAGSITLAGAIAAGGNWDTLSLRTGASLNDGNAAAGADITVTNLAIRAATGIGAPANPLETQVTNLAFSNTGAGGVAIANTGALTIASVDGLAASSGGSGTTTITASSPLTVSANLIQAGSIDLTAGESAAAGDDLTVTTGITIRSTAGEVTLRAGDQVTLAGTSLVESTAGSGTVTLLSGSSDSDGAGAISGTGRASAPNVVLDSLTGVGTAGSFFNATAGTLAARSRAGGGVFVSEADGVTLNTIGSVANVAAGGAAYTLRAAGAITVSGAVNTTGTGVTALATTVGSIAANANVGNGSAATGLSSAGQITGTGTISGTNVALDSVLGVGVSAADRVNTAADTLAARSTTGGGVFVSEANAVTLDDVAGVTNAAAGGAAYNIAAAGALTVSGPVNPTGSGTTTLATTAGGIALGANVGNAGAATTLTSAANITRSAGSVFGTTVALSTPTAGANGIGTSGSPIQTTAATITAAAGSGGVFITESDGASFTASATGAGNIALASTSGTLDIGGATSTASGNVTLSSADDVTISAAVNAGSGSVLINANTAGADGAGFTQNAGGSIATASTANNAVFINVNSAANGSGSAVLRDISTGSGGTIAASTAIGGSTAGGSITQTSGVLNTGTGSILLSTPTGGASSIGTSGAPIQTNADSILVQSGAGGIFVTEATGASFFAPNAAGAGNIALTSTTGTLTVSGAASTGSGTITLTSGDAVAVTGSVNAGSGKVAVNANTDGAGAQGFSNSGTITTTNTATDAIAVKVNAAAGGTGSAAIGAGITAGTAATGTINIDVVNGSPAGGAITRSAGTLTANTVTLNAATGIGSAGALVTAASNLGASNAVSGNVNVANIGPLTITGIAQAGGGDVTVANAGNVVVGGNVTAGAGNVALTAGGTDGVLTNNASIASTASVTLNADQMTLAGGSRIATSAGGAAKVPVVTLRPTSTNQQIELGGTGTDAAGRLALSQAELDTVRAGTLRIGRNDANASGPITVASNVTLPAARIDNLHLITGSSISGTAGGISVAGLVLEASSANLANAANDVITLAANITPAGNAFTYTGDANAVVVGSIDGVNGITTNNGNVTIGTTGPLALNQPINAGTATVTLNAGAIGQTAAGPITTGALIGTVGTTAVLNQGNAITNLGPFATGGNFTLNDVSGGLFLTGNVGAGGGAVSITTAGGALALQGNSVSGVGGVSLQGEGVTSSGGAITSTAAANSGTPSGGIQIMATGTGAINLAGNVIGRGADSSAGTASAAGNVTFTTNNAPIAIAVVNARGGYGTAGDTNGGDAGTIVFNVGGANTLTLNGDVISRGGDASGSGNAGSGRDLAIAAPTLLGADVLVAARRGAGAGAATAGNLTFNNTVESPGTARSLTVATGATTTFAASVGGNASPLASLTTDGAGTTAINGGAVTTTGGQTYNDAVTLPLGSTNVLASTGNAPITFGSTLDGTAALTVTTGGITTFSGSVGGMTPLIRLVADGGGTTALNGGNVTTTDLQRYTDAVTLGADTTINAGDLVFANTIESAAPRSLTVTTPFCFCGAVNFGGAVGGNGRPLSSLVSNGFFTNVNGGSVTTTGAQTYNNILQLGADAVLTSTGAGDITLGPVQSNGFGNFGVTVNTAGTTALNVAVTSSVRSLTTDAPGSTVINTPSGPIVDNRVAATTQTYNDPVRLATDAVLVGNSITFGSTVQAPGIARRLTVNGAQHTFAAEVGGGGNPLLSLATFGSTALNAGAVITTNQQAYGGPVTLGANTVLTSGGAGATGNITFASTLQSPGTARTLTVNTAGTTTFGGAVGGAGNPLAMLVTDAPGTTAVNGGAITTTGDQAFSDSVTLGANTALTSTGGGAIAFASTIDGAFTLDVNTFGATTFGGAVGATTPLVALTTDFTGTTAINGGTITTTRNQGYNDAVTLGADSTLTALAGNLTPTIRFGQGVESAGAPRSLTVNTQGFTEFTGSVGTTANPLRSVTTDAPGQTWFTGAFIVAPEGPLPLFGGDVRTTENQTFNDVVNLTVPTVLTSTGGGSITVNSVNGGGMPLTVNTAGLTNFNGVVGLFSAPLSLTTDAGGMTAINGGAVTTTGAQIYNDTVTLGANATLTSTGGGALTFAGGIAGPGGLIANTAGVTTISMGTFFPPLASLTTDAAGATVLSGILTTAGAQAYNDPVTLNENTTLISGGGNITFGGTLQSPATPRTLDVFTAGTTTFGGAVGGAGNPLQSVSTNVGGTTVVNGGAITTTGLQSYGDAVAIGADTTLTSTGGSSVLFGGPVNGPFALNLSAGRTAFSAAVGGSMPLAALTIDAPILTVMSGGAVTTTGAQTYNGPIAFGADATLTSTGGGALAFGGLLVGPGELVANTAGATAFAGAMTFPGVAGGGVLLGALTTDAPGTTAINGAMTTAGAQTYNDAVTLGANATLTSTGGGAIAFATTLNGAFPLAVNTAGVTTFGGAVGAAAPLTSITTDAAGTTAINGGSVRTSGAQTYNDPVTLGANATLTSTGSGALTFAGTLNGAFALTANTAGATVFGGTVGSGAALASLTTDGNGMSAINAGAITTTGNQTYGDPVVLGANNTLTSTGGNVAFASTVNADAAANNRTLTVNAPAGSVIFSGNIGNTQPLADLDVTAGPSTIVFNAAAAQTVDVSGQGTNTVTFNAPVLLAQNLTVTTDGAGSADNSVTFAGPVNADAFSNQRTLTVTSGVGTSTFGPVGNTEQLGALTVASAQAVLNNNVNVTGGGDVNLANVGTITVAPGIAIDTDRAGGSSAAGDVTFGAASRLNAAAPGANFTIDAAADGGGAAGHVDLGTLGDVNPLGMVSISGDSVVFRGPLVANQVFVDANTVETPTGRIFAGRDFSGTDPASAALTLRGLTTPGLFGTRDDPIQIDAPGLFVVIPNDSNALPFVFLAGDPNRRPVYEFAGNPGRRFVFYNGVLPDSAAERSARGAIFQQLRTLLDELSAAGFAKENIRKQLLQGLVLEAGLARPAIDEFTGEGVTPPTSCQADQQKGDNSLLCR